MSLRILCYGGILLLAATPASANASMGLAFGIFPFGPWLVFVIATVLFEAWAFSKPLKLELPRAVAISAAANFLTAIFGLMLAEVFFHGLVIVGSRMNPNLFAQTMILFTVFAIGSGIVEYGIWDLFAKRKKGFMLQSVGIHLLTVPLGLAILLIPSHPYRGMEGYVEHYRAWYRQEVAFQLDKYIRKEKRLPPVHSYEELVEFLRPQLGWIGQDPCAWAAELPVDLGRFSTGEKPQKVLVEWNPKAKYDPDSDETVWLSRSRANGKPHGIVLMLGSAQYVRDGKSLGFD